MLRPFKSLLGNNKIKRYHLDQTKNKLIIKPNNSSPLVHKIEFNILALKNNHNSSKWLGFRNSKARGIALTNCLECRIRFYNHNRIQMNNSNSSYSLFYKKFIRQLSNQINRDIKKID